MVSNVPQKKFALHFKPRNVKRVHNSVVCVVFTILLQSGALHKLLFHILSNLLCFISALSIVFYHFIIIWMFWGTASHLCLFIYRWKLTAAVRSSAFFSRPRVMLMRWLLTWWRPPRPGWNRSRIRVSVMLQGLLGHGSSCFSSIKNI